jgi:hypothetical protein
MAAPNAFIIRAALRLATYAIDIKSINLLKPILVGRPAVLLTSVVEHLSSQGKGETSQVSRPS